MNEYSKRVDEQHHHLSKDLVLQCPAFSPLPPGFRVGPCDAWVMW
jgi:hypothetical protein